MLLYLFRAYALNQDLLYNIRTAIDTSKTFTLNDNHIEFTAFGSSAIQAVRLQNIEADIYYIMFVNGKYLCRTSGNTYFLKICDPDEDNRKWIIQKSIGNTYMIKALGSCLTIINPSGSDTDDAFLGLRCDESRRQRFIFSSFIDEKKTGYDAAIELINKIENKAAKCHKSVSNIIESLVILRHQIGEKDEKHRISTKCSNTTFHDTDNIFCPIINRQKIDRNTG